MTSPVRIQLSRAKGFNLQAYSRELNGRAAINVSRPSMWGNPFIVGQDGDRDYCVFLFRMLLAGRIAISAKAPIAAQREFIEHAGKQWPMLRGKNLACWCTKYAKCHADILLELANRRVCEDA